MFVFDMIICIFICVLYFLLILWWVPYYNKLEYHVDENTVCIKSGILFQRNKQIYFDRILWETRVTVPFVRGTVITQLHTVYGTVNLFGSFQRAVEKHG